MIIAFLYHVPVLPSHTTLPSLLSLSGAPLSDVSSAFQSASSRAETAGFSSLFIRTLIAHANHLARALPSASSRAPADALIGQLNDARSLAARAETAAKMVSDQVVCSEQS